MGEGLIIRSEAIEISGAAPVIASIDRDIGRTLSAEIAENQRLAFAQSFAYAVMVAGWHARGIEVPLASLSNVELVTLSPEAADAATRLGAAIAVVEPRLAAYLAGTIYTTALPEAYRATHGIFIRRRNSLTG